MAQINIPRRNQRKDFTSFFGLGNNQTANEFIQKDTNENNIENSLNLSLRQINKSNSNNNSKEKKKSTRYYQVRILLFNIPNI